MAKKAKEIVEEPLEKKLWKAADKLRKNMDAAEYKHVALGLIFLKYISDAFEELYNKLKEGKGDYEGADPEDKNEYVAEKVFYVPPSARWTWLQGRAKLPTIGKDIDEAMDVIEKDNPSLKGVLPKVYAQEKLDKGSLGGLVDLVSTATLGTKEAQSKDLLGRVFEYFLGEFALAEGKKGGQFYTPESVVKLLVEMLEPYEGRVFDPCCGSGGMFVQSEKFIKHHQDYYKKNNGKKLSLNPADHISIYGQESNQTTWRLAKMNLAIRGIDSSNVKWNNEGSFLNDAHKDLKADFIIANPPFNDSDWSGELLQKDARWVYGVPPTGNANFAWVQHFLYHLKENGFAGFVLGNSSLSATNSGDGDIRKKILEEDLVDCVVAMPNRLFYNTSIPACLWFLTRNKKEQKGYRKRENEVLLIDARKKGTLIDKNQRVLTQDDLDFISGTYHNWKSQNSNYFDIPGFCKSVTLSDISKKDFNLSPNKYIELETDLKKRVDFKDNMAAILENIHQDEEMRISLEKEIQNEFKKIGYKELSTTKFSNLNISNLLELSRTLFHYWFIDFEFPNKNLKPYKTDKGLFENSIHGQIPKGWRFESLQSAATVVDCLHTKKPDANSEDTGNLLLQVYNIADDGILDLTEKYFISEEEYKLWTKNIEAVEGDCVITNTGRVGAVAQIPFYSRFAVGRNITAVRPNKGKITPAYLINYLLSAYMQIETYRETDIGTILDSLNVKGIKKINILIPPPEVLKTYESFARPIRKLIEINSAAALTRKKIIIEETEED